MSPVSTLGHWDNQAYAFYYLPDHENGFLALVSQRIYFAIRIHKFDLVPHSIPQIDLAVDDIVPSWGCRIYEQK